MDLEQPTTDDSGGPWTEERHSAFLNWLEETFVRRMLSGGRTAAETDFRLAAARWSDHVRLPLDRYLPDSATESTRDLPRASQPKKHPPASRPASPAPEEEQEDSVITSDRTGMGSSPLASDTTATLHQVRDANDDKVEATLERL